MKKALAMFTMVAFAGLITGGVLAADMNLSKNSVGFIEVQKVFTSFKETKKAQDELSIKEKEYKKAYDERQEKLNKMKIDGKSNDEIEKQTKKMEEELKPLRDQVLQMNEQLTVKLQAQIIAKANEVAKDLGIDLVLDKQVVIVGGTDITDMVINKLNK